MAHTPAISRREDDEKKISDYKNWLASERENVKETLTKIKSSTSSKLGQSMNKNPFKPMTSVNSQGEEVEEVEGDEIEAESIEPI